MLLQQGIGDTIRISLTPEPGGDRTLEVKVAQELLQTMGFRTFVPLVAACPGCGRTTSTTFQELAGEIQDFIRDAMPDWKTRYPGVEGLNVAVMGCIVNGPGESKHADIGISLPGTGETPTAPVFIDGKKAATLRGPTLAADFKQMVIDYIERRYGTGAGPGGRRRSENVSRFFLILRPMADSATCYSPMVPCTLAIVPKRCMARMAGWRQTRAGNGIDAGTPLAQGVFTGRGIAVVEIDRAGGGDHQPLARPIAGPELLAGRNGKGDAVGAAKQRNVAE